MRQLTLEDALVIQGKVKRLVDAINAQIGYGAEQGLTFETEIIIHHRITGENHPRLIVKTLVDPQSVKT